jgi:chromosome segregation ATPase
MFNSHGEAARLRKQNAELKAQIEEMEQAFLDNQHDQENLLEEKSNLIRDLHRRIQEMRAVRVNGVNVSDLVEQLEVDRRRLNEDEQTVMAQMRDMEISISKERAELARERGEVLRLLQDTKMREELSVRDTDLRNRVAALRGPVRNLVSPTRSAYIP